MSPLEIYLPLDPLFLSTYWAWLIALCVATIATFSRLPDLPFLMGNKLTSKLLSSSHPVERHDQLTRQKEMPCEAEKVGNKFHDGATCIEQEDERKEGGEEEPFLLEEEEEEEEAEEQEEGDEENKDRSSRRAGEGRKRGVFIRGTGEEQSGRLSRGRTGEEEEEKEESGENIPPLWVYSLLEASRTPSRASLETSSICTPSPSSWSQALNTRISERVGKPWDILEAYVPPLVRPSRTSRTSDILRNWPCQRSRILLFLQGPPPLLSSTSAVDLGTQDYAFMHVGTQDYAFMHVGFCSEEIWLWDEERGVCANHVYGRKGSVSAFGMLGEPGVAIAAGPDYTNSWSSLVSFWDDRYSSCNLEYGLTTPAGKTAALACRAFDVCMAEEAYVSMHDSRMLREEPLYVYSCREEPLYGYLCRHVCDVDVEGLGKKSKERVCDYGESGEDEYSHERGEQLRECVVMDTPSPPSASGLHNGAPKGKRRCPLITNCLPFMCFLDKKLHLL